LIFVLLCKGKREDEGELDEILSLASLVTLMFENQESAVSVNACFIVDRLARADLLNDLGLKKE